MLNSTAARSEIGCCIASTAGKPQSARVPVMSLYGLSPARLQARLEVSESLGDQAPNPAEPHRGGEVVGGAAMVTEGQQTKGASGSVSGSTTLSS